MGRRTDPRRVLAAQVTGLAAAYAHMKRLTRAEALAEIGQTLAASNVRPGSADAVDLVTQAASMYVDATGPETWWFPDAVNLLAEAGADVDRAKQLRAQRPTGDLSRRSPG